MPSCPPHLDDEARKEWRRIAKELFTLGLLTKIDKAGLAGYCQAWSDWVGARQHIQAEGRMFTTPNGHQQPSPWLSIVNKALDQVRAFASEFGMTPSTRSRVEALPVPPSGDRAAGKLGKYLHNENDARRKLLFGDDEERAREMKFFGNIA
jgi:P27 family predicted phage terminase small subunit